MKTAIVFLSLSIFMSVAYASDDNRPTKISVNSAIVCAGGYEQTPVARPSISNLSALEQLNLMLADENGVEVQAGGIILVVKAPFSVSAPVMDLTYPGPATTRETRPTTVVFERTRICVTVTAKNFGK